MSVMPCAFRVAAVVMMMNQLIRLEKSHARDRYRSGSASIWAGASRGVDQRVRRGVDALVLGLLRGLPEEAVGRDRRAEDRDDRDQ